MLLCFSLLIMLLTVPYFCKFKNLRYSALSVMFASY